MKKNLHFILPVYLIATFLLASWMMVSTTSLLIPLLIEKKSMDFNNLLFLMSLGIPMGIIILLLLAAWKIYKFNDYKVLKILLWLSVPTFNVFGLAAYEFYFAPFFYFGFSFDTLKSLLTILTRPGIYLPLSFNYELNFNFETNQTFMIGVNIFSLLFIKFLNKFLADSSSVKKPQTELSSH